MCRLNDGLKLRRLRLVRAMVDGWELEKRGWCLRGSFSEANSIPTAEVKQPR